MVLLGRFKRIVLGEPLSNSMVAASQERIPKWKALAVLSSDALSSVAYATEEILIPLSLFLTAATAWSIPIAIAITSLLVILTISYRQTIDAYPGGSGAYRVAKENLGENAGLFAGASLLIDYTLTVAVSVAAGVENIASAFPGLLGHKEALGALVIFLIMLLKLRGVRESATIFALPTYLFIFSFLAMLGVGFWRTMHGMVPQAPPLLHETYPAIPAFLVLKALASGCTALTGVEAISDGVSTFRPPAQRNAKITLSWMAFILGSFFLGMTILAHYYGVLPHHGETAVSQLAHAIFGEHWMYYLIQISTALILVLAANTAYSDFPRVSSFLARDRFLPRQLASVGDRLVFSNGILGLSLAAMLLIVLYKGSTHRLIPLYAVGVFFSFTLSQSGMVLYHAREKKPGWMRSLVLNALGAVATLVVLLIIASSKFTTGAWMVLLLIPALVFLFKRINAHYLGVSKELTLIGQMPAGQLQKVKHTVIIPVSGLHRGVLDALRYAISISDDVRACYVEIDAETTARMKVEWARWAHEVPFVVLKSPYRSVIAPLLEYIEDVEKTTRGDMMTVIIPEFVTAKWWHQILHNQTAFLIRAALMFRRGKVVTSVRYHLKDT